MKKLAKLFLGLSLLCLVLTLFFVYQRYVPQKFVFASDHNENIASATAFPEELIIKNLNIDLPVIPAENVNGVWETTGKGVSFSNGVFYGHNWPNLLGKITNIKPNQKIQVKYNNQKVSDFTVTSTSVVSANNTDILENNSNGSLITIYTCTGFLDSKRFVVLAKFGE